MWSYESCVKWDTKQQDSQGTSQGLQNSTSHSNWTSPCVTSQVEESTPMHDRLANRAPGLVWEGGPV